MEHKDLACTLYYDLENNNEKINIITKLFKIHQSTLYRWLNEKNENITKIKENIFINFNSHLINLQNVLFIISFFLYKDISKKNIKLLKRELNKFFPNNNLSNDKIHLIINKNKHCLPHIKYKGNNKKISIEINNFIIESIKKNNCLTAKDISDMVNKKFNKNISTTTIYSFFKKNNYVYKKTKKNINPYHFADQKQQLLNVYEHLNLNSCEDVSEDISNNDKFKKIYEHSNEFEKLMTENFKTINKRITLINNFDKINSNKIKQINSNVNLKKEKNLFGKKELISIDEMSIITNRIPTKGWALKNEECIVTIQHPKPNVRYSLLMATSKKKIIKYILVKGSIKTDDYISFMKELNEDNINYSYLIDNAAIHKNKKTFEIYKQEKMNIIYNAPYQSEFNPIEMVFSLLRKKLNKKIVKNDKEINEVMTDFVKDTKETTLTNIFNHSKNALKDFLKI